MDMKKTGGSLVIYWNFLHELEEPGERLAVPDSDFSEGIEMSKKGWVYLIEVGGVSSTLNRSTPSASLVSR